MPKNATAGAPVKRARKPTPPERIPRVVAAPELSDHLEIMTRAIFQAGLSWALIDSRWKYFHAAFEAFDVELVAEYGDYDIERIMTADGVIHSRAKITGTIANARALRDLIVAYGSVAAYAGIFASYEELFADARERFAFLGDLSCYYWLFRTGLRVPPFERWMERQKGDHPRMREMVLLGRGTGASSEAPEF